MIDQALRRWVRERAEQACEYCLLRQNQLPFSPFHIEHIIPRKHGGGDHESNLALACLHCNSHKGPNLAGLDPDTNTLTALFNPRQQIWSQHFAIKQALMQGLTPVGRVTVGVLRMNANDRINLRAELNG